MNIESLPSELQDFVRAQVVAGNYPSETEVVASAVRLLRDEEENYQRFRAEVQRRVKSLDEGNYLELNGDDELAQFFEGLKSRVREKYAAKQEQP